ncbi:helix-turn-helix domain-containing protein [Streptomyces sp. NPDC008150]|uniref:helix-turn-helix domain-containing protein n=1 Tax=Streptomyces sp. NPDC008150 TaxID=3364816 RepID=UPI0036E0D091
MATVHHWTGLEARALRLALRMSVRTFAEHLGVAVRTVSKWEKSLAATAPRPDTQAILDTALLRADAAAQLRFEVNLAEAGGHDARAGEAPMAAAVGGPRAWEYESWTDDLDRAAVALSRQDFVFADDLLRRWLSRFRPVELDDKGLYLLARSTTLLGDLRRDRGTVLGPLSARRSYADARSVFAQLHIPRRVAQLDLCQAVVAEMSDQLDSAARQYASLMVDERLSRRDRARARLWVGTVLSKNGDPGRAVRVMGSAVREFEDLAEPEDWSVAQQKLALAHRGTGDLTSALHCIDVARTSGVTDSPLQRVRLDTAHGHILLSDPATLDDGLRALDSAGSTAATYGLSHQLRSIEKIKAVQGADAGRPADAVADRERRT